MLESRFRTQVIVPVSSSINVTVQSPSLLNNNHNRQHVSESSVVYLELLRLIMRGLTFADGLTKFIIPMLTDISYIRALESR